MTRCSHSFAENKYIHVDKKRHNRFEYRNQAAGYLMILPALIGITIFVIIPLIMALFRAFQDYNTKEFVGFFNFQFMFQTDTFAKSFGNVLIMTAIVTTVQTVISFLFANVLKALNNKLGAVAKVVVYIPFFISGIAASIIFTLITNFGGGLVTNILIALDKDPVAFTKDVVLAYTSIIVPLIWLGFGYRTLVMYSGLINIPDDYYQAASIDGANWLQRTTRITVPAMKNTFVLIITSLITGTIQCYELVLMMTEGGPLGATQTPVFYIYQQYSNPALPQNATIAGALVIMVIIMSINIVVFKTIRSKRSEDQ